MHRIDGPGATVDNEFTEGDPTTAVPATVVTDDWLNDVQEELISILTAAGIAPVKGDQDQVLTAITQLITAAIPASPPDASTTVKGIVELATSTETLALTDSVRAVTPAGLAPLFGLLKVAHIVAQNTSVAGAAGVNTRPLNTVQHNSISGASLASNQITLPAGTYEISGYGLCTANAIKTYLYNVTDAANALLGSSVSNNNANDADQGRIDGVFTLAATKVLEVRHSLTAPVTSTALGRLTNLVGNEVYAVFTIRRIG